MLRDDIVARVNGIPVETLAGWAGSDWPADGVAVRETLLVLVAETPDDQLPLPYFTSLQTWWRDTLAAELVRVAIVE